MAACTARARARLRCALVSFTGHRRVVTVRLRLARVVLPVGQHLHTQLLEAASITFSIVPRVSGSSAVPWVRSATLSISAALSASSTWFSLRSTPITVPPNLDLTFNVVASNGQIPSSWLGNVPGSNAGLLKPAALSYTAMHYHSLKTTGVSLAIVDGAVGRTYRSYARQVMAKQIYGSNAATPGSSNHGYARAIDLMSTSQRSAIDRIGARYGFAKRCSDASWEWWHVVHNPGCTGASWKPAPPRPDPLRKLGKRQRAAAERLLWHRRERKREARTGKGRSWRRHDRMAGWWYKRVRETPQTRRRRTKKGAQNRARRP